jgi:hypothetical protein
MTPSKTLRAIGPVDALVDLRGSILRSPVGDPVAGTV